MTVETAPSNKRPWNKVRTQTGTVPEKWLRTLLTSNDLFPFAVAAGLPRTIVPVTGSNRLHPAPEQEAGFWATLERIYEEHKGQGRSSPRSLMARIDFNKELSRQIKMVESTWKRLVLHPTSGDIMRAARTTPGTAVIQHTIHCFLADTVNEAAFLVGVLNAPALTRAFSEARTSGRHFTNSPWRAIPIPHYDPDDTAHREIVRITKSAEKTAEKCLSEQRNRRGQVGTSNEIRQTLTEKGLFGHLDDAVSRVLPDYVGR